MKVKSRLELELRDLPYIESPFFAASYAAELIDHPVSDVPRNRSGKEMSVKALERELRDGQRAVLLRPARSQRREARHEEVKARKL